MSPAEGARPQFFYDLGDPESYIAAERVIASLPIVPEWIPISADGLPEGRVSERPGRRVALEALAARRGLQPLRWPAHWPGETRRALIVATYAKQLGRVVAFSLAAFRQAYAGGRELADDETLLIAGAACELHPNAVAKALERPALGSALDLATVAAVAAGVKRVPALTWEGQVFHGDAGVGVLADVLETEIARAAAIAEALRSADA
ncbi:DsbA family protein [Conexibacter sp. CPCC 206217]|uniref:DsbA family protein n=1 Tax=Conexibacter sp. CPCC 206217 TaxID=3064574 RepID=UPI002718B041|nr:DsbA family protein [Conexibacter sp. CPCC 206217]MDO8213822.1 DsbA family protein [Conexibacter sp. CPCC 206217]